MDIAQTLVTGTNLMTPWIPRLADNAIFTYQDYGGNAVVGVDIIHKNREDTGTGEYYDLNSPVVWTDRGNGFHTIVVRGLKEMVRFQVVCGGAAVARQFRFLPPIWFDTAG